VGGRSGSTTLALAAQLGDRRTTIANDRVIIAIRWMLVVLRKNMDVVSFFNGIERSFKMFTQRVL
jgi:hypothetical protein